MFLVDSTISISGLQKLFLENYRLWGGRYNPFVPVFGNQIDEAYIDLIKYQDPDIIYYSPTIDLNKIKEYRFFHPTEYIQLDKNGRDDLRGVYSNNLLSEHFQDDIFFSRNLALVHLNGDIKDETLLFYQLNFGIRRFFVDDDRHAKGFQLAVINNENYEHINRTIHQIKPYFMSLLSEIYAKTTITRATNDWAMKNVELIIYDDDHPFDDHLYFWNRQLYQEPNNNIKQLIASKKQIEKLIQDPFFGVFLYEMLRGTLYIISKSIVANDLNEILTKIRSQYKFLNVDLAKEQPFPFKIMNYLTIGCGPDFQTKNVLIGSKDYLKLPVAGRFYSASLPGHYAYDLELERENSADKNKIKFPFFTELYSLVTGQTSRINSKNNISLLVTDETKGVDIKIPSDLEIIRTRLVYRHGKKREMYGSYPLLSNAGKKLSAFIDLFAQNWFHIEEFIGDKFWLHLFMGNSDFKNKKLVQSYNETLPETLKYLKPKKGDVVFKLKTAVKNFSPKAYFLLNESRGLGKNGLFSYKDLITERKSIYYYHKEEVRNIFKRESDNVIVRDDYLYEFIQKSVEEDFELHIDPDLQYLVDRDALYIGMKVKCDNCGSNSWYALGELKNKMQCKGCFNEIIPAIKSELYYKLNDIVVNNLTDAKEKEKKQHDGNYVVLKTLIHLKSDSRNCYESFLYAPCMDIKIKGGTEADTVDTDIDILAIQDGKFIIGEAKCRAQDFKPDVLNQFIKLANILRPDKIILAYNSGVFDLEKLKNMKSQIDDQSCEIIPYKLIHPWYKFGRIFGLPDEKQSKSGAITSVETI